MFRSKVLLVLVRVWTSVTALFLVSSLPGESDALATEIVGGEGNWLLIRDDGMPRAYFPFKGSRDLAGLAVYCGGRGEHGIQVFPADGANVSEPELVFDGNETPVSLLWEGPDNILSGDAADAFFRAYSKAEALPENRDWNIIPASVQTAGSAPQDFDLQGLTAILQKLDAACEAATLPTPAAVPGGQLLVPLVQGDAERLLREVRAFAPAAAPCRSDSLRITFTCDSGLGPVIDSGTQFYLNADTSYRRTLYAKIKLVGAPGPRNVQFLEAAQALFAGFGYDAAATDACFGDLKAKGLTFDAHPIQGQIRDGVELKCRGGYFGYSTYTIELKATALR